MRQTAQITNIIQQNRQVNQELSISIVRSIYSHDRLIAVLRQQGDNETLIKQTRDQRQELLAQLNLLLAEKRCDAH